MYISVLYYTTVAKMNCETLLQKNLFFVFFEVSFCARLASKFADSAKISKHFFAKFQYGYKKTQNLILILNMLKKLQKMHAKKVVNEKVMENLIFLLLLLSAKLFDLQLFKKHF